MIEGLQFDRDGLLPCVAQDFASGEVLTLAYMNEDSLRLTLETNELHFYSRSRGQIWRKGETSGNLMRVRQLRYDCDGDALLAVVELGGPACHTGERSCFYRELGGRGAGEGEAAPGEREPLAACLRGAGGAGAHPAQSCRRATGGQLHREAAGEPAA